MKQQKFIFAPGQKLIARYYVTRRNKENYNKDAETNKDGIGSK